MASIQHTVHILDTTSAFDDEERTLIKELVPHMTNAQLGKLTQVIEGHESRLKAFEEKHGKKAIIDWDEHIKQGKDIISALRPGSTTLFLAQKGII